MALKSANMHMLVSFHVIKFVKMPTRCPPACFYVYREAISTWQLTSRKVQHAPYNFQILGELLLVLSYSVTKLDHQLFSRICLQMTMLATGHPPLPSHVLATCEYAFLLPIFMCSIMRGCTIDCQ